jgi:ribosome maturation factor RimP
MDLSSQVSNLVEPILEDLGYSLVRVEFGKCEEPKLQVMAEPSDGSRMTTGQCAEISRRILPALDKASFMPEVYQLEVSSPGLDRPLVKKQDYIRFTGYEVKIELNEMKNGQRRFRGKLAGIQGEHVSLIANNKEYVFPYDKIIRAKIVITDQILAGDRKG